MGVKKRMGVYQKPFSKSSKLMLRGVGERNSVELFLGVTKKWGWMWKFLSADLVDLQEVRGVLPTLHYWLGEGGKMFKENNGTKKGRGVEMFKLLKRIINFGENFHY